LVQELNLLQTRGSELCMAIFSSSTVWSHLSEGMQISTVRHIEMVGQLIVLWAVVSSTA
jgi:hypothetical protein